MKNLLCFLMGYFGLGDLAYWVFRPLVYLIDAIWGTDMRHCSLCKARRKRWNTAFSLPLWAILAFLMTLTGFALWWGK